MKTTNKFPALALMAVAMVFTACSKDDNVPSQKEIETKIVGKWKRVGDTENTTLTNERCVRTYALNGKGVMSVSRRMPDNSYWWSNATPFTYSIEGNTIKESGFEGIPGFGFQVVSIDDEKMVLSEKGPDDGQKALDVTYSRVTADYSQDILGMWEGVEMTGYETYGNAEARIEYRADGTYTYYVKDGENWIPSTNVDNEYNVDGDWLATRWRPEAGADYNYEWWDIDEIKDGMMKWSALREKENGERFTTTFTWRKVELPSQQEIEAKIVGKWKFVTKNGDTLLTNAKVVRTYYSDNTATSSASLYIDETRSYAWENKIPYTWNVEENMVCDTPVGVGVTKYDKVISIDSNQYSAIGSKMIDPQGMEHMLNMAFVAQKVTADYSQDILGMWEGVEMTGYETYGDAHHRIEYRADGTYTYYSWDEAAQAWKPLEDVFDEWNVDGDWLVTRWQNKGSDVMNYEWWDIDYIKDGIMKWSALREKEDGTRFTTTFTWKKVR